MLREWRFWRLEWRCEVQRNAVLKIVSNNTEPFTVDSFQEDGDKRIPQNCAAFSLEVVCFLICQYSL
jgi:hypothetical protein